MLISPSPRISMWCRVNSGQLPRTNDSARQRSSTASSATRRCPRTTRSRAHSLLPIPLSPTTSTPRPRMSIRTPWTVVRGARKLSSTAPSRDIVSGVAPGVRSSGTAGTIGGFGELDRRREPLRDEDRGNIVGVETVEGGVAALAGKRFQVPDFTLTEDQHPAAADRRIEARQCQAGLLRVGLLIRRSSPALPASNSRCRPPPGVAATSSRTVATVTPAGLVGALMGSDGGKNCPFPFVQSGSISPRFPSLRRYRMLTASESAFRKTMNDSALPSRRSDASSIDIGLTA